MKIRSMFHVLVLLMAVLTLSLPVVALAQQASGADGPAAAMHAPQNPVQTEAVKAAAERDANRDINEPLWFGVGIGAFCIGGIVGGIAGCSIGSVFPSESNSLSDVALLPLPNEAECLGGLVGVVTGGVLGAFGTLFAVSQYPSQPPIERFIGKLPEYVEFYTDAYSTKTQSIRKQRVAAGAVTGLVLSAVIIIMSRN